MSINEQLGPNGVFKAKYEWWTQGWQNINHKEAAFKFTRQSKKQADKQPQVSLI